MDIQLKNLYHVIDDLSYKKLLLKNLPSETATVISTKKLHQEGILRARYISENFYSGAINLRIINARNAIKWAESSEQNFFKSLRLAMLRNKITSENVSTPMGIEMSSLLGEQQAYIVNHMSGESTDPIVLTNYLDLNTFTFIDKKIIAKSLMTSIVDLDFCLFCLRSATTNASLTAFKAFILTELSQVLAELELVQNTTEERVITESLKALLRLSGNASPLIISSLALHLCYYSSDVNNTRLKVYNYIMTH